MNRLSKAGWIIIIIQFFLLPVAMWAAGIEVTDTEMQTARQWFKDHLLECKVDPAAAKSVEATAQPVPRLEVLANYDPVIPNSRGPRPLTLGTTEYKRGLFCHAPSRVVVVLPSPAKSFSAVIGVDNNPDTARGCGSVVFSVRIGDKAAFTSEILRFNTPAQPISVDLAGADRFTLEIGDSGDGISCDQSDWADAKVTLEGGKELWLGDLPLIDTRAQSTVVSFPRTSKLPFSFVYGGRTSDQLLGIWTKAVETKKLDDNRTQHSFVWTDTVTG
ncbi:MAG: hypothetical protein GX455_03850, partial [Phycisphaerae bacterium]|nr:hypothetical protein [Phycisphaerae bacterium]